jgi:hypothetical protein
MQNKQAKNYWRLAAAALLTVVVMGAIITQLAALPAGFARTARAAALQQIYPWTAVASTGVVDETGLRLFEFKGASVTYRQGVNTHEPFVLRYNVTNPSRFDPIPGWTVLELGSTVPIAGSFVAATLIRVDRCTGQEVELCTTTNNGSEGPICTTCNFAANAVDYTNNLYYVRLVLRGADNPPVPSAHTLRLY